MSPALQTVVKQNERKKIQILFSFFIFIFYSGFSFAGIDSSFLNEVFSKMCRKIIVDMALDEGRRVDGRNKNQVTTFVDYFLFTPEYRIHLNTELFSVRFLNG